MNILIVTYYRYPNGDAGAIRQNAFAKLYQSMGHNVFVIGMGNSDYLIPKKIDQIDYISFRNKGKGLISKFKNILGYKKNLINFLNRTEIKFDAIQIVNIPINAFLWIRNYAKKNNIKLIHDSVEWYSPKQFKLGMLSPAYLLKDINNRYLIDKSFTVIAISKFLKNHFSRKGIKTVRIPVILDVNNVSCYKNIDENITKIVYAGNPGNKDKLKRIIDGLTLLNLEDLKKLELRILGVNKDQLLKLTGVDRGKIEFLGKSLNILGKVPREVVFNNLKRADFTILLRDPEQRYAKAGFPTKVVESLSTATPVICNITSDLGDYLKDMENSIIIKKYEAEAVKNAIKIALEMTKKQKGEMFSKARLCAEDNFDYRKYDYQISKVIK